LRLDAAQLRCKIKFAASAAVANPRLQRELMRDLGRLGGKARQAKYQSLSPEERKAIVDKARKTKRENRLIRAQLSAQRPAPHQPRLAVRWHSTRCRAKLQNERGITTEQNRAGMAIALLNETRAFTNISATTSAFLLRGGLYGVTSKGTWGTATLQRLAADATTYVTVVTAITADGYATVSLLLAPIGCCSPARRVSTSTSSRLRRRADMVGYDPKVYRNLKDGVGSPGDPANTDSTSPWTMVASRGYGPS
jgi:hypothetical protein